MSIDPTTLPACTLEDGSAPGQVLPCHWDAAVGNGTGRSFTVNVDRTLTYDAVPADVAQVPAPVPAQVEVPVPVVVEVPAEPIVLTAVPLADAQVQVAQPAPVELAHTGVDPMGGVLAGLMVGVGVVLVVVRRWSVSRG